MNLIGLLSLIEFLEISVFEFRAERGLVLVSMIDL